MATFGGRSGFLVVTHASKDARRTFTSCLTHIKNNHDYGSEFTEKSLFGLTFTQWIV